MAWKESWLTKADQQQLQVNGGKTPSYLLVYEFVSMLSCQKSAFLYCLLQRTVKIHCSFGQSKNKTKQIKTNTTINKVSDVSGWLVANHMLLTCFVFNKIFRFLQFFFFNITIREKKKGLKHQSLLCGQTPANSRNPWFKHN